MTTVRIADIVPFAISDFVTVDTSINIDTTGTPSNYQILLELEIRSEMLLRVDGNVFSELAAGIYFVAIRNGDVAVYFIGPLGSITSDFDFGFGLRCDECDSLPTVQKQRFCKSNCRL